MRLPFALAFLVLAGCADPYPPTFTPDYAIRVAPSDHGMVALPPPCPSWATEITDPFDNQPIPQFGCSNARNLAIMVDQPQDLIKGRDLGPASAVTTIGAIRRYNNNQTRGLVDPDSAPDASVAVTTATTPNSPLTGDTVSTSSPAASGATPGGP